MGSADTSSEKVGVTVATMRSWEYLGNQKLVRVDRPVPEPGRGEVRIRIAYVGICGTDLHEYYEGPVVTETGRNERTGAAAPIIPGHEASGVVDALGADVDGLAVGDRVTLEPIWDIPETGSGYNVAALFHGFHAHGFLADYAVTKKTSVHRLPGRVTLAQGALVEPLAVCVHAVERAGVRSDDSVVIFGAGPIGVGLANILRARGVANITVVEPSALRSNALREMGFRVINARKDGFEQEIIRASGGPARIAFDAAGAPGVLDTVMAVLQPGGVAVLVATYPHPVPVDAMSMIGRELSIVAVNAYDRGDFGRTIDLLADGHMMTDAWVGTVDFENAVSIGYPKLREAAAAKILVEVNGGLV
jgi:(R,R)-butanediol dehydrogenase/meso-butanediol dehydrogenase/diacetyl reductase